MYKCAIMSVYSGKIKKDFKKKFTEIYRVNVGMKVTIQALLIYKLYNEPYQKKDNVVFCFVSRDQYIHVLIV